MVDAFSRIVRLGERLAQTGRLSDDAMGRTIDALRVCANKLRWRKVERVRLVATEACRMAENGPDFIARVQAGDGPALEIIDRETEAGLAAVGAEPLVDRAGRDGPGLRHRRRLDRGAVDAPRRRALRDGGLDLAGRRRRHHLGALRRRRGRDARSPSRPCATICARCCRNSPSRVSAANGGLPPVPSHLLGTSGTVTTIAGVQLGLQRYDRSRVDGCWLNSDDIGAVTSRLLHLSYEQRAANPCIGRERADLVLAGCAILEEIRLAFPAERIRVADRGLREGILTLLMKEDGTYGSAA